MNLKELIFGGSVHTDGSGGEDQVYGREGQEPDGDGGCGGDEVSPEAHAACERHDGRYDQCDDGGAHALEGGIDGCVVADVAEVYGDDE